MGFLSGLFGGTPKAEISQAEQAEAQLLAAMREGWNTTGLPAQRERIAQTLGMRWNPETGSYAPDQNSQAMFDGQNIRQQAVQGGNAIASVSNQYEAQRPAFNGNNGVSSIQGDISQAKDEAGAVAQTAAGGVQNALSAAGNAAGLAHGAQMQSLNDLGQLSNTQATQANANAANAFGRSTNNRNALAGLAGAGMAVRNNMPARQPLPWTMPDGTGVG